MKKIFISHSTKDRGFVTHICEHLQLFGVPVWYSKVEIPTNKIIPKEELEQKLSDAIHECSSFILLIDDFALESEWVKYEIKCLTKIISKNPSFPVIPIINEPPTKGLPQDLSKFNPIDFNRGYNKALSILLGRLGYRVSIMKVSAMLSNRTRTYSEGTTLQSFFSTTIDPNLLDLILKIREEFVNFKKPVHPRYIIQSFDYWSYQLKDRIDFIEGNSDIAEIPNTTHWKMIVSSIPTPRLFPRIDPVFNSDYQLLFVITLFYPSYNNLDIGVSLIYELGKNGAEYFWVTQGNKLHKFSLGSKKEESRLLSMEIKMGSSQMAFQWHPRTSPSMGQFLANSAGEGMLYRPNDILTNANAVNVPFWKKIVKSGFKSPDVDYQNSIIGFIHHGGIFYCDNIDEYELSPLLLWQLSHIFQCAGAKIFNIKKDFDNQSGINLFAISDLQARDFFDEHDFQKNGITEIKLDNSNIAKSEESNNQIKINVLNQEGLSFLNDGSPEKAIKCFNKILEIYPKNHTAYFNIAKAYDSLNELEDAVEAYTKALELKPGDIASFYSRGIVLNKLCKHEEAIKDFKKVLNTNPTHAKALIGLGFSYINIGSKEKAIEAWEKASAIDKDSFLIWNNLFHVYREVGKYDEADQAQKKANKIKAFSEV